ncbi:MAG: SpoIIE family protein phosphatase [Planctomycetota bacterium]|nr:SpoIIE family protein phosphatase [Planctomycetota bacterium]
MALRIALPVLLAVLLSFIVFTYVIQVRISGLQFADLGGRAYPAAKSIATFGRILLIWKDRFENRRPDYDAAREWPVKDHWLVTGGFMGGDKLASLVGVEPGAEAPVTQLERAIEKASLLDFSTFMGKEDAENVGDVDMIAAYILDLEGRTVAANHDFGPGAAFFPLEWRRVEPSFGTYNSDSRERFPTGAYIDRPNGRGMYPVFRLSLPIAGNGLTEDPLGSAVVVFRTDRIQYEQRDFLIFMAVMALLLLVFVAMVSWHVNRRAMRPLRRLAADMHALADGDLARRSSLVGSDEIGMLAQAFNSMAERLRLARMNEKEASRLESDLAVARQIQNNLLPSQTPQIRGLDVFTSYRPAREIGGDYYDFLPVDGKHMGIIVADASGKSIPAALVMSSTRAILRFVAPGETSAAETLDRVNAILSVDIPRGMFVTACYLILDPLESSMTVASAGHNPLLVARADDSVELVNPGGIALGFDRGPIFQRSIREQKVRLLPGDRVLAYTDGAVECANAQNEEYSDRRLREFVRRNRELSSRDFVGALVADLDRHRGAAEVGDDTTIVTFKVL